MNSAENINFKALSTFRSSASQSSNNQGVIKPNNYGLQNDTVEIKKNDSESKTDKKSKLLKWGAIVGSGIVATTIGVLTAKHISVKNAKKAAEELKKIKLQELEKAKAEQLKKAEEARIAQEKALKAQQEAREKAIQEAKIRAEKEAKIKAEKQAQLEATRKAQKANWGFKYDTDKELAKYIDPKREIRNNIKQKEGESFDDYFKRQKESSEKVDILDFDRSIRDTEPNTVFNVVFEQFKKCHENGGTISIDDFIKTLESTKSTMDSTYNELYRKSPYCSSSIYQKFHDYKKYIDKVIAEIKSTNAERAEGESAPNIVRKALKNLENKKIARQNYVSEISQHYEQELDTIRGRLKYD